MAEQQNIPPAVRRQIEEAERLAFEAGLANAPAPEGYEPEPDEGEGSPQNADGEDTPAAEDQFDTTEPVQEPEPEPEPDEESYARKYEVLQGKYNAETQRYKQENSALHDRVNRLEEILADLSRRNTQPEPEPEPEPQMPSVTPQDIESYGQDFIDFVRRAAGSAENPMLAKMAQQVQALQEENNALKNQFGQVQNSVVETARDRLFTHLDREVDGWRELNASDGFRNWIGQLDPYAGVSRQELLMQAFNRNDAPRVAAFFKGYQTEYAAINGDPTPNAHASNGQAQPATKRVDLGTLAAPRRGRQEPAPSSAQNDGPSWTQAQISKFYREVQSGAYRGRETEKNALEASIFKAQREGRVT